MITSFNKILKTLRLATIACLLTSTFTLNAMKKNAEQKTEQQQIKQWYGNIIKAILNETTRVNHNISNIKNLEKIYQIQEAICNSSQENKSKIWDKIISSDFSTKDKSHPLYQAAQTINEQLYAYALNKETSLLLNNMTFDMEKFEKMCAKDGLITKFILDNNNGLTLLNYNAKNESFTNLEDAKKTKNALMIQALRNAITTVLFYIKDAHIQLQNKKEFPNVIKIIYENNSEKNVENGVITKAFFRKNAYESLNALYTKIIKHINTNKFFEQMDEWIKKDTNPERPNFDFGMFKNVLHTECINNKSIQEISNDTNPQQELKKQKIEQPLIIEKVLKKGIVADNKNDWAFKNGCYVAFIIIALKVLLATIHYNSPNPTYKKSAHDIFSRPVVTILAPWAIFAFTFSTVLRFVLPKHTASPILMMIAFLGVIVFGDDAIIEIQKALEEFTKNKRVNA